MNEIKYTHRTKSGHKARIIATNRASENYPVIVLVLSEDGEECVESYTKDLKFHTDRVTDNDLVEYSPWHDVAVDTVILVKNDHHYQYFHRHFAYYKNGKVHTWIDGRTSWSVKDWDTTEDDGTTLTWQEAKLAE